MMDMSPPQPLNGTAIIRSFQPSRSLPVFPPTLDDLIKRCILPLQKDVSTSPLNYIESEFIFVISGEDGQQALMPLVVQDGEPTHNGNLTTTHNLNIIKNTLSLSVTQLAELFNVTRKSVYDWFEGAEPRPTLTSKIRAISDMLSTSSNKEEIQRLKFVWKIPVSGSSFLNVVNDENLDESNLRQALAEKLDELSPRLVAPNRAPPRMSIDIGTAHISDIDRPGDFS